ncbi:hypothetical protein [Paenibacillus shenyangensis]|nr:hypothetical protein [Paenibacillus sp. A9]
MNTPVKSSSTAWSRNEWAEAALHLILSFPGMAYRACVCILACIFGS